MSLSRFASYFLLLTVGAVLAFPQLVPPSPSDDWAASDNAAVMVASADDSN